MKMNQLGRTGIKVSALCLGSMSWGSQNTARQAHAHIDRALAAGINFIDTAEMYPVNPVKEHTIGRTERIIGLWFENHFRRNDIVLATKHSGVGLPYIRSGAPITAKSIPTAVEGSLRRLKTDYIDLYQFHWPNRGGYMFRQNWHYDPSDQDPEAERANMEECLLALQAEVKRGTIRAFGLSNESAWGTMQWLATQERVGGPRAVSIQNEYSLLCRLFDTDMAELSLNEDIGLLAFSPLAGGLLTGKYQHDMVPKGSRMTYSPELGGRKTKRAFDAVETYLQIAERYQLDPVQMALSWCFSRPFMTSVIFGATTIEQIDQVLGATQIKLSKKLIKELDQAHQAHPMPY